MHRAPKKKRNKVRMDFFRMKIAFCFVCCLFLFFFLLFVLFFSTMFHYIVIFLPQVNLDPYL